MNQGKTKALIISVSDYNDNKLKPLDFCKKDGEKVHEVLNSLSYGIADSSYELIGNVKFDSIRDAIYDFFDNEKTIADDTLVFYYSGHGIPTTDGHMCIASSEINPDSPRRRGFSSYELATLIHDSISTRIVEVLDCCYSGAAQISKGNEDAALTQGKKAIEYNSQILQKQGQGRYVLAASQAAEEAYGSKIIGHSIFTYHFLEGLRGSEDAVDNYGNVTPYTLGNYIYKQILNLPSEKRPKQTPIIKAEAIGDTILANYPALGKRTKEQFENLLSQGKVDDFNTVTHNIGKKYSIESCPGVYRLRFGGITLSKKVSLSNIDLHDVDLCRASMDRSRLPFANLRGANLARANATYADLQGAELAAAYLHLIDFSHCNLSNANLSRANLKEAILTGTNLLGANLSGSALIQCTAYSGLICKAANFENSIIDNEKFLEYLSTQTEKVPSITRGKDAIREKLEENGFEMDVIERITAGMD